MSWTNPQSQTDQRGRSPTKCPRAFWQEANASFKWWAQPPLPPLSPQILVPQASPKTFDSSKTSTQFPGRNPGCIQFSWLQKQSRAWEDKRSREKALYRVLTKQKLKGIFGTGNSDLYGMIPKGKVKGRDSGRQTSRVHGNSSLHQTFHTRPANCRARAAGVIMLPGNQPNCDNSRGYVSKKTGT